MHAVNLQHHIANAMEPTASERFNDLARLFHEIRGLAIAIDLNAEIMCGVSRQGEALTALASSLERLAAEGAAEAEHGAIQ